MRRAGNRKVIERGGAICRLLRLRLCRKKRRWEMKVFEKGRISEKKGYVDGRGCGENGNRRKKDSGNVGITRRRVRQFGLKGRVERWRYEYGAGENWA